MGNANLTVACSMKNSIKEQCAFSVWFISQLPINLYCNFTKLQYRLIGSCKKFFRLLILWNDGEAGVSHPPLRILALSLQNVTEY
jgi:hypothetical protein